MAFLAPEKNAGVQTEIRPITDRAMEAPPGLSNEEPAGTAAGASSTNGRRKMFDSHLEAEAIEAGLASGALGGRNGGVEVFWMLDGIF